MRAFQEALVRLAADAGLRARFSSNATDALAGFALEPREREALLAISARDLERYARSLLFKRWSDVAHVFPLSTKISPSLGKRYRAWLAKDPAIASDTVLSPGAAEALRALPALRRALAEDRGEAIYAPEVLAYEALSHASRIDREPRFLTSRFAVHELVAELRRGVIPIDPEPSPTELRFDGDGVRWRKA